MFRYKILLWILIVCQTSPVWSDLVATDPSWLSQTNAQIEKIRKRDAYVYINDHQGKPLAGVTVNIKQARKAFPFGAAISSVLLRNAEYKMKKGFDYYHLCKDF